MVGEAFGIRRSTTVFDEHGRARGIFGVYSYREVFEFDRFWAIGSGRTYALGAMFTAYDKARSARELAEAGVRAGCEFDKNSALPLKAHTLKLKG